METGLCEGFLSRRKVTGEVACTMALGTGFFATLFALCSASTVAIAQIWPYLLSLIGQTFIGDITPWLSLIFLSETPYKGCLKGTKTYPENQILVRIFPSWSPRL